MSQLSRSPSHAEEREFFLGLDTRVWILTTAAETDGRHDFTDTEQPAGVRTPLHLHTRYDERFWVMSGSLIIWAGPETVTLRSGDYYAIPMNVPHAIETGPDGARALQISSPAGFAELIARAGTPVRLGAAAAKLDEELFMAVTPSWAMSSSDRPERRRPMSDEARPAPADSAGQVTSTTRPGLATSTGPPPTPADPPLWRWTAALAVRRYTVDVARLG